jgi:hypothetical protein
MKRRAYLLIILFPSIMYSQVGAFYSLTASRFARATGLGNVYTGIAEGAEAAYYNNAGLAFENSYSIAYSDYPFHSGCILSKTIYPSFNFALSVTIDSAGNNLSMYITNANKLSDLPQNPFVLNFSYSRKIINNLALGIGINYYYSSLESDDYIGNPSKFVFDFSFAALYKNDKLFSNYLNDQLKLGLKFNNLLSSNYSYIDENQISPLAQD